MPELAANKLWKQSIANYDGPFLQENPKDISPKTDNSVIIYSFVTLCHSKTSVEYKWKTFNTVLMALSCAVTMNGKWGFK